MSWTAFSRGEIHIDFGISKASGLAGRCRICNHIMADRDTISIKEFARRESVTDTLASAQGVHERLPLIEEGREQPDIVLVGAVANLCQLLFA